jgi:hypothetical protein
VVLAALGNLIGLVAGVPVVVLIAAPLMIIGAVGLMVAQRKRAG